MNKEPPLSLDRSSSPEKVPQCGSVCVNMYKQCGGHCTKKRGHVSLHRCGWCRYTWERTVTVRPGKPPGSGPEIPH
jgi:hypothetical protein